jgi:hypothetical protein
LTEIELIRLQALEIERLRSQSQEYKDRALLQELEIKRLTNRVRFAEEAVIKEAIHAIHLERLLERVTHGTQWRYSHKTMKCHCDRCTLGHARYMADWRAAKIPDPNPLPPNPLLDGEDDPWIIAAMQHF